MAGKSGRKMIFGKSRQYSLKISCGSKISSKLYYVIAYQKLDEWYIWKEFPNFNTFEDIRHLLMSLFCYK